MVVLTVRTLESLTHADAGKKLRDGGGLFGVVRANIAGAISVAFSYRYRFAGKHRDLRCGTWPEHSLKEIRAERDRARAKIAEGGDPAELRKAAKFERTQHYLTNVAAANEAASRITLSELFERWERFELSGRKDKGAEVRRSFNKDVLPRIGQLPAEEVTRSSVAAVLDTVVDRGARIIARNLLGDLRQMFGFAIIRGYVANDPTSHMKRDDFGRKVERDRVLAEPEIKELASKLPAARMQRTTELALRIMLLSCCRVGELSQARWADIDFEARTWAIPAANAKNAKAHTIFLSDFALLCFRELHAITGTVMTDDGRTQPGTWCYPASNREGFISLKAISKQVRDRQRITPLKNRSKNSGALLLSGGEWTPHDLRRTGATLMGTLGVRPDIIEKCLNHVEQNRLKRIYQRQELKAEQAEAWRLLGERLEALLGPLPLLSIRKVS